MKTKLFLFSVAVVMLCACGPRSKKKSKPVVYEDDPKVHGIMQDPFNFKERKLLPEYKLEGAHGWKSPGYGTWSSQNFLNSNEEDTMMTRIFKERAEKDARKQTKDSLERASRVQDSLKNLKKTKRKK